MSAPEQYDRTKWTPESLLAALSTRERGSILALGRVRQYHSGEVLFNQGDLSDFIVIIIDGYVKITAISQSGTESLIAIRAAGDIVGELAAFDGRPRSARWQVLAQDRRDERTSYIPPGCNAAL